MGVKSRLWTAWGWWLLCANAAYAQHWTFRNYGAEAGLTNPTILALNQDRQGYLWVATEGGLFRYDGDRFRHFEASRPGNAAIVTSLHTSTDGQFWAGSTAGLFRWSSDRFRLIPQTDNVELESAQAIASDSKTLYLASTAGLWSLSLKANELPRRLTTTAASSVFVGRAGSVWFGCGSRLCRLIGGQESEWTQKSDLPMGPWNSITEDSNGALWIRSDETVWMREPGGSSFREIAKLESTRRVLLVAGHKGDVMAPHRGGLAICSRNGCRNFGVESGLEHSEALAVDEDREGSLWIAYNGHGLARWLGREQWQSFTEMEGLQNQQIWRVVRDRSGRLWVGTHGGLFRGSEEGGRWHFRHTEILRDWTVYGLLADPDGSLWLGTFESGLKGLVHYKPDTGQITVYPPAKPGATFSIKDLSRDNSGRLWAIGQKQIFRLDPGSQYLQPVDLPVSGSAIYSILHAGGAMYVSGRNGLYVERGGRRRLLTIKDGLKDNSVQSVTAGPSGEIWIAYYSAVGISRLDWEGPEKFHIRNFITEDGLISNLIYSQFFDARGRHWIATDSGVAVQEDGHWVKYDTTNGLVWNDCNAQSFLAEPDGAVWIGTSAGLARFFPSPQRRPVKVYALITAVLRNDEAAVGTVFDSSTRSVGLRFTMLSFNQENPIFRYRLGSTQPWAETRAREVQFAELPPGSYRFEVQGDIGTGGWSYPGSREFVIQPAWFRSRPFLLVASALIAGLMLLGWQQRERHQRKLRADLEAAVEERTRSLAAATARAEQESRFKGEFLANMSHEMRTPLNGVLGLTKLALETSNQPEVAGYLATVQVSAKVLLSLINDVLDLAKIEAGMLEIVPVQFAPRTLLEEVRMMMESQAQSKGLALQTVIDEQMPEWLKADDSRLRQVLVNLIGNAIKFTHAGRVRVFFRHDGTRLRCAVEDTGIGIAPEKQALVFDMFRQADGSISRSHGGTGLGLAISRKLVQSMGGTLGLQSEPGRGSTFWFDILAPRTAPPAREVAPTEEAATGQLQILVAEDNKVNQLLLLALLRKRGHVCVVANDGKEALEAWAREPFDLILMDVQMPEVDGIQAVRRIREKELGNRARIPVIAVTARAMMGDRDEILAAGMDDYLEKPIRTEQLDAVLSRFARRAERPQEADAELAKT